MMLAALFQAMLCAPAFAQSSSPVFEAVSVKVSASPSGRTSIRGGPGTSDPGQMTFVNTPLLVVIQRAYDVKSFQVTAPGWLSSEKYDIIAKVPPDTSKEQCSRMLQGLLAERFHLAVHHETKELRGFELLPGRGGAKLEPSAESETPEPADTAGPPKTDASGYPQLDRPGLVMMEAAKGNAVIVFLTARAQPVSALVVLLSREFRMPILDKTGLTGKFDFKLEFAPQPPGSPDTVDDSGPNLITAIQQQLGLRLNPNKIATDMLIVDRADKVPVQN